MNPVDWLHWLWTWLWVHWWSFGVIFAVALLVDSYYASKRRARAQREEEEGIGA